MLSKNEDRQLLSEAKQDVQDLPYNPGWQELVCEEGWTLPLKR